MTTELSRNGANAIRAGLALAAAWLIASGCASKNVDPPTARPHTGYVDFHADPPQRLSWQIQQIGAAGRATTVFEQYKPVTEPILRLAFAPGRYQLQVAVLNYVLTETATLEVEVKDGMITPVRVTLTETGSTLVENKTTRAGGAYYGRYGRGTRIRDNEAATVRVNAGPQVLLPYQPKAQMPYAGAGQ